MRYLLDTNIISNIVRPKPSESLLAWMGEQRAEDLFIASLTIAEIRRSILEKPRGKKRDALDAWFAGPEGRKRCLPVVSCPSTIEPVWSGRGSWRMGCLAPAANRLLNRRSFTHRRNQSHKSGGSDAFVISTGQRT